MSLKDTINQDIKTAMKAKDQAALRALRAIKAAILKAETAEGQNGAPISEDVAMKIVTKEAKQRQESVAQFTSNGREDLAEKEAEELAVIERYLPEQLTGEKLEAAVKAIVEKVGATTMKDMGKVMGMASKELAGKADGKAISQVVKALLQG
ncbi:MAG: GatB/YqeY domain-containing protein [Bacteroidota bacterium]